MTTPELTAYIANGGAGPRQVHRQKRKLERTFARRHHATMVETIAQAAVKARTTGGVS